MEKYKFNKEKLEFVEVRRGIKWWGRKIFQYLLASILLAAASQTAPQDPPEC